MKKSRGLGKKITLHFEPARSRGKLLDHENVRAYFRKETKRWSTLKYGYKEARRLAMEWVEGKRAQLTIEFSFRCRHCEASDVELVARAPYSPPRWICPECDSTYVLEEYSK